MLFPYGESVSVRPWKGSTPPERVLWIRLGATGDVFATLPFAAALREKHPHIRLDLLTRKEYTDLPDFLGLFDHIYPFSGGTSSRRLAWSILLCYPKLLANRYLLIADLQRNRMSQWLRRFLLPQAWGEFDRFSPKSVLSRIQWSVEQLGLGKLEPVFELGKRLPDMPSVNDLMKRENIRPDRPIIVLNPAGFFPSRNWPLERYAAFAQLWAEREPNAQFILLGDHRIKEKADQLTSLLPEKITNLTGQTTIREAYSIVCQSHFMLTEDSGLGHMSWLSGIKTLMLLGSTRADWTAPIGAHTACLHSSDLPCGNCMKPNCPFPENICLTRYSAQTVFERAWALSQLGLAND